VEYEREGRENGALGSFVEELEDLFLEEEEDSYLPLSSCLCLEDEREDCLSLLSRLFAGGGLSISSGRLDARLEDEDLLDCTDLEECTLRSSLSSSSLWGRDDLLREEDLFSLIREYGRVPLL
jgi:hypothetical protein